MIGDSVLVDLRQRNFLGADRVGEIPEMFCRKRDVGGQHFQDRVAVIPRFGYC